MGVNPCDFLVEVIYPVCVLIDQCQHYPYRSSSVQFFVLSASLGAIKVFKGNMGNLNWPNFQISVFENLMKFHTTSLLLPNRQTAILGGAVFLLFSNSFFPSLGSELLESGAFREWFEKQLMMNFEQLYGNLSTWTRLYHHCCLICRK